MVASFESTNDNKGKQGVNEQKVDDSLCFFTGLSWIRPETAMIDRRRVMNWLGYGDLEGILPIRF